MTYFFEAGPLTKSGSRLVASNPMILLSLFPTALGLRVQPPPGYFVLFLHKCWDLKCSYWMLAQQAF